MTVEQPGLRCRSGFGIVAIVVFTAIVAALMVASLPVLIQNDRWDRARRTAAMLVELDTVIDNVSGINNFRTRVIRYPGRLSHLSQPITTAQKNVCAATYSAFEVTSWAAWGPFIGYEIGPLTGLATPLGVANDSMPRTPTGVGSVFAIVFRTVDEHDFLALDQIMDAGDGRSLGRVRWTLPALGVIDTVYYRMDLGNNSC